MIFQYQIVLVNLDPTIGSEIRKTRPCVVVSPDEMNTWLQTVVIVPVTSVSRAYPTRLEIKYHHTGGWLAVDQIRTIDRQRIIKALGELDSRDIIKLKSIIREAYVD